MSIERPLKALDARRVDQAVKARIMEGCEGITDAAKTNQPVPATYCLCCAGSRAVSSTRRWKPLDVLPRFL